jgi:hypothetical protein
MGDEDGVDLVKEKNNSVAALWWWLNMHLHQGWCLVKKMEGEGIRAWRRLNTRWHRLVILFLEKGIY